MASTDPLSKFLRNLNKDPAKVRKSFLAATATIGRAENAFLILGDGSQPPIALKKRPEFSELQTLVSTFEKNSKEVFALGRLFVLRLKSENERLGVLVLLFQKKKEVTTLQRALEPLCRIYSFWESTQLLRNFLKMQQESLQALSAESAMVAQDYVRLRQQMVVNQNRLHSITKGILRTQEEERAKISRDLHDGIGQELTALKMNLDVLSSCVEKDLSPENRDRWMEARTLSEQTLQEVRELSRLLRPRMLDDLGLFPTLRWYVRNFTKRVKIPVELGLQGEEEKLNTETQTILFRIVQEALNNVAKHSRAKSAIVSLECNDEEAHLRIADDGVGFDAARSSAETGSGLAGMRDRVALYKGTFAVYSEPLKGTRLEVLIPL
ncbi:sensor histidine kinase [bacterium]|nr:sensor histidine kinase [bacterium]